VTTTPGDPTTSGKHGIASGNQVFAPITAPVNVCGNAAAVLGKAAAGCAGGAHANGSGVPNLHTSGEHGIGAGNQAYVPVKAPIDVCGNVAAVFGSADPGCGAGGDHGHSRLERQSGDPVALGTPVLPMLSELTKAPAAVPASALPVMPQLPAGTPARTPADPALPVSTSGLPVQVPALPVHAPAGMPQLPVSRTQDAPAVPADVPAGELVGALPSGDLARPSDASDLTATQLGGVTDKASGLQQQVGAMHPAAQVQPLTTGMNGVSLYVLVIGTLLAGAAVVCGVFGRLRRH
jgi:hypothetical protein